MIIPCSSPRRILALDVGSKRIGVAITDLLGITAQGLETIRRQNKRKDMETLGRLLKDYEVREVVVGLPLRLSGAEGTQSEKMRRFASDLESHFGVTVHLWDERWTSTEANRLLRETELSIQKRGRAVDRMAAILILQSWMEAHGSGRVAESSSLRLQRWKLARLKVFHFSNLTSDFCNRQEASSPSSGNRRLHLIRALVKTCSISASLLLREMASSLTSR